LRYNETVLDHFERPRNVGVVVDADADVTVESPRCGDTLRLSLRVHDGRIVEARFLARGCGAAIASASRLTELLTGLPLGQAAGLEGEAVASALGGLPPGKGECSGLAARAAGAAVADYRRRAGVPPVPE